MKNKHKTLATLALVTLLSQSLMACAPEIGSDRWCAKLKEKPKGDWSMNEVADYAKHCLIKLDKKEG